MNANESFAALDEPLEGSAILARQWVTSRLQENGRVVFRKLWVGEDGGILRGDDLESVCRPKVLNRFDAGRNRSMTKARRARVNQDSK